MSLSIRSMFLARTLISSRAFHLVEKSDSLSARYMASLYKYLRVQ